MFGLWVPIFCPRESKTKPNRPPTPMQLMRQAGFAPPPNPLPRAVASEFVCGVWPQDEVDGDGEMRPCDDCLRAFHLDRLQPPPAGPRYCPKCHKKVGSPLLSDAFVKGRRAL